MGILLAILIVVRLILRRVHKSPPPLNTHKPWEQTAAKMAHWLLYGLVLVACCSGYFIATAKGQAVDVFNWFSVPAIITSIDQLEEISGQIHEICVYTLIVLSTLHAAAALKHHVIDKDRTLLRIFGK